MIVGVAIQTETLFSFRRSLKTIPPRGNTMHNDEISRSGNVVSLDAARQRLQYIALAQSDEDFRGVAASFALSGIDITNTDAERTGRVLAGLISYEQVIEEIRQQHAADES